MGNLESKGEFLSGSIGITILKKDKRVIVVFADAHSNVTYCKNNSKKVSNWIGNRIDGNNILIEEVPRSENIHLNDLWQTEHVQELKDLYLKNSDKITGTDLRPYLKDFSYDLINIDKEIGKTNLKDYLEKLRLFFISKNINCNNIINNLFKQKVEKNTGLRFHFEYLKKEFNKFYEKLKNENLLEKDLNFINKNNKDIFNDIDFYLDSIIEWYTLCKIFTTNNLTIIHTGLYHSINIIKFLEKFYKFEIKYNNGIVDKLPSNLENLSSCVYIPQNIKDKYIGKNKYIIF